MAEAQETPKQVTCGDLGGRTRSGAPCTHYAGWGLPPEAAGIMPCRMHCGEKTAEQFIRERNQRAFLAAFRENGNVTQACIAAGIDRKLHYWWLEQDESYPERFEDARLEAAEGLEFEARRRAVEGLRRYRFNSKTGAVLRHPETNEAYYEHEYSDMLLVQLLRANLPQKYRDRQEISGPNGGPITVETLSPEERAARVEALLDQARRRREHTGP
jgi:hypothetical protein